MVSMFERLTHILKLSGLSRPLQVALYMSVGVALGLALLVLRVSNAVSYVFNSPKTCMNCHVMTDSYSTWRRGSHGRVAVCGLSCATHEHGGQNILQGNRRPQTFLYFYHAAGTTGSAPIGAGHTCCTIQLPTLPQRSITDGSRSGFERAQMLGLPQQHPRTSAEPLIFSGGAAPTDA